MRKKERKKTSMNGFNSRLDSAEERFSDLDIKS